MISANGGYYSYSHTELQQGYPRKLLNKLKKGLISHPSSEMWFKILWSVVVK